MKPPERGGLSPAGSHTNKEFYMKAICLHAPRQVSLVERERPALRPGYALLRIKAAGICGSDLGAYRGTNPLISYPRILGHELAGEIVEIDGGNPRGLKTGDRVVADPYLFCGHCYPCSLGRTNCCEDLQVLGVHVDGGFSEYFLHPTDMLLPIPDGVSWADAALAEPLTIALHCLHRTGLRQGMHIAINGAGTIGLLAALSAKSYGAEPVLIDPVPQRLSFARSLGISHVVNLKEEDPVSALRDITGGRMAEVVMEASGASSAIRNTLDMVSFAGSIGLTGWPKSETALPTDVITRKEIDIAGCRTSVGEFQEALELIQRGEVNVQAIVSDTISLDAVPQMLQELSDHPEQHLKSVVLL